MSSIKPLPEPMLANIHDAISSRGGGGDSSSSRFYFQQNTTMEQYQEKHFVDISKHIETLLHWSDSSHPRSHKAHQAGNQNMISRRVDIPNVSTARSFSSTASIKCVMWHCLARRNTSTTCSTGASSLAGEEKKGNRYIHEQNKYTNLAMKYRSTA